MFLYQLSMKVVFNEIFYPLHFAGFSIKHDVIIITGAGDTF